MHQLGVLILLLLLCVKGLSDVQGAECVKEAFRQGINFFDTSPYYGVTRSETVSC